VHIKLDRKLVVDNIVDNSNNQYEVDNIMAYCKALVAIFFKFKISFIRRQTNYVVHNLGRVSKLHARY